LSDGVVVVVIHVVVVCIDVAGGVVVVVVVVGYVGVLVCSRVLFCYCICCY